MTDRVNRLYVALERDIREDDVEALVDAIRMMRGVMGVETHVTDEADWVADERARREVRDKIQAILWPKIL